MIRKINNFIKDSFPFMEKYFKKQLAYKHQPNWKKIIKSNSTAWKNARNQAQKDTNQSILIPTSTGLHFPATTMESALAVALTLRGANVEFVLCDGVLPACVMCSIYDDDLDKFSRNGVSKTKCKICFDSAYKSLKNLNIKIHRYSDFVKQEDLDEIGSLIKTLDTKELETYMLNNMAIGEHASSGALRYYARGDLNEEKSSYIVLSHYFKSSMITKLVFERLLSHKRYDAAVFHHGIYIPMGTIGEVCRKKGIHVVNWNPGYRRQTFVFSHHNTYHKTMITEDVNNWTQLEWDEEKDEALMAYLNSRKHGGNDWINFYKDPNLNVDEIIERLHIDLGKPIIGLLTSVVWDARLHYESNAFPNMIEWVLESIRVFWDRSDVQLVIRIHPAELTSTVPSRQKVMDEIEKVFNNIPDHITIIPPEDSTSTYALAEIMNCCIIYNTKTGIELSALGIPIIVAGEAWIRNKGFSLDVSSKDEYREVIARLPVADRLSGEKHLLAKKYAYHFFFKRMIDVACVKKDGNYFQLNISDITHLAKGVDDGIDVICDGILRKKDFINRCLVSKINNKVT